MVLGITQIRLKWKNFVAESDSNNAAEKYAKKAVL